MTDLNATALIERGTDANETAERMAESLSDGQVRQVAALHLACQLRLVPTAMVDDTVHFGSLSVKLKNAEAAVTPLISYADRGTSFGVSGATIETGHGPTSLRAMVDLIAYAARRAETLTFLPADIRQARIRELSERTGVDETFARFMLAQYPALSRSFA